jgi:hypothetical protein
MSRNDLFKPDYINFCVCISTNKQTSSAIFYCSFLSFTCTSLNTFPVEPLGPSIEETVK